MKPGGWIIYPYQYFFFTNSQHPISPVLILKTIGWQSVNTIMIH